MVIGALRALAYMSPGSKRTIDLLRRAAKRDHPDVRREAERMLQWPLVEPRGAEVLVESLRQQPPSKFFSDEWVEDTSFLLAEMVNRRPGRTDDICGLLHAENPNVRRAAARGL